MAVTKWMCENFYDIRTFGAVMSADVNSGQVLGPVQITFATSIEPIVPSEISITRMAVTNEKDVDKERTMGRKFIVLYGLYRAEGFISAPFAKKKTGFSEEDLAILKDVLVNMFECDYSSSRSMMRTCALYFFRHAKKNLETHLPRFFLIQFVVFVSPKDPLEVFLTIKLRLTKTARKG